MIQILPIKNQKSLILNIRYRKTQEKSWFCFDLPQENQESLIWINENNVFVSLSPL